MNLPDQLLYRAAYNAWLSRIDPERAHGLALDLVERIGRHTPIAPESDWRLQVRVLGLTFPNPIGLAAGVDKDARAVVGWARLGFGSVEIGTVTPRPQPGNPPPRVFRLREDRALINRLGFPSAGAVEVARRLADAAGLGVPIGLNVGKNADTPIDQAIDDYGEAIRILAGRGDYAVINVSSPNTTGLRDLQAAAALTDLVRAVQPAAAGAARSGGRLPLLVKIAPDLSDEALADIVSVIRREGIDGVIATNTTVERPAGLRGDSTGETGGLSGRPLRERSTRIVREVRQALGRGPVLIGVGGIDDAASAFEKLRAGADLVQLYTGLVYAGPGLAGRITRELGEILAQNGLIALRQLRE